MKEQCDFCCGDGWTLEAECCDIPCGNECCGNPIEVQERCPHCEGWGTIEVEYED